MRLPDLLSPRRIVLPLGARTLADAVQLLIDACVADGCVTDPARLQTAVAESWPEDTVSIGPNAFLPHFRTAAVRAVVVALGISPTPIRWGSKGRRQARIVLLVIAPPGEAAEYLQTVAAFAKALAQPELVAGLLAASTPSEVLANSLLGEILLEGPLLVGDIMTRHTISVGPEAPLREAADLLLQHRLEALPVLSERGEVIGMISNGELLRYLVPSYVQRVNTGKARAARRVGGKVVTDPGLLPVREAMMRNVLCLSEDQTLAEAATLMANKDLDWFPVVNEGVLTGFLTRADVVRKVIGRESVAS